MKMRSHKCAATNKQDKQVCMRAEHAGVAENNKHAFSVITTPIYMKIISLEAAF